MDGAKAAHRWTNEANQLQPIKLQFGEGREEIANPTQAVAKRLERCTPMWCKHVREMPLIKTLLGKVERSYKEEQAKRPARHF